MGSTEEMPPTVFYMPTQRRHARGTYKMEQYSRLANPQSRRITIRLSIIEIELRARPQVRRETVSQEERAYRRAAADRAIGQHRHSAESMLCLLR